MVNENALNQARILVVDDEQEITSLLKITLHKEGFHQVEEAFCSEQVLEKISRRDYDLIILDVILPDGNGLDLCKKIREYSQVPILFLTAKTSDLDKLTGFAMGADDYITKPFNPLELVARIKVHLKRQFSMQETTNKEYFSFKMEGFEVYEESGELFVRGEQIECPARELQLLLFLCRHPNHLFSRTQLYEQIWGEESLGDNNTVMVHIRRLREKIEKDPGNPEIIVTVRGLGYKLVR